LRQLPGIAQIRHRHDELIRLQTVFGKRLERRRDRRIHQGQKLLLIL
jgi:hypothetical protein